MRWILIAVFLAAFSQRVQGQQDAILTGRTVQVHTLIRDTVIKGGVVRQNGDSIFVMSSCGSILYGIPWKNLDRIEVRVPSKARKHNAVAGAIAGAILGIYPISKLAKGGCSNCSTSIASIAAPLIGIDLGFALLGAGVGVIASRGSWETRDVPARN